MKTFLTILNVLTLGLIVLLFATVGSLSHFYVLIFQSLPFLMFLSLVKGSHGKFFRYGTLFVNGFALFGGISATIEHFSTEGFGVDFFVFFIMVFVPFVLVSLINFVYVLKKTKT